MIFFGTIVILVLVYSEQYWISLYTANRKWSLIRGLKVRKGLLKKYISESEGGI